MGLNLSLRRFITVIAHLIGKKNRLNSFEYQQHKSFEDNNLVLEFEIRRLYINPAQEKKSYPAVSQILEENSTIIEAFPSA